MFRVLEPEVLRLPVQSPDAVQLSTLLVVQSSVVEPSNGTLAGLADRLTIGAEGALTVTLTVSEPLPPGPVQVRVYVRFAVRLFRVTEPEVLREPDQLPEAVQAVASMLFQLRTVEPPDTTFEGFAARLTVGGIAAATEMSSAMLSSPSGPEHVSTKLLSEVSEAVTSEPTTGLLPDQSPEATQLSAPVAIQLRMTLSL